MSEYEYYFPNRTVCDVLEEMRKAVKTLNFSYMPGLIEEVQSLANKMEAGLGDKHDIKRLNEIRSELKKEVKELELQRDTLAEEVAQLKKEKERGVV